MTVAASVLMVVLLAGVLAALAFAAWRSRSTEALLFERRRRRVIVTLKSEAAFRGVLYATDQEALVLREAEALAYGAQKVNVPVEGELVVLRADLDYLQVLPAVTPA